MRRALSVLLSSLLAASIPTLTAAATEGESYQVGAGDTLDVHVYGEPDLSRTFRVDDRCAIEVGLIGGVAVCGRTTSDVSADITLRLADGYLNTPVVSVNLREYGSQTVLVTGEVVKEAKIILDGPTTVLEAIVAAGGRKQENVVEVQVVSRDGAVRLFDLQTLAEEGSEFYVKAGDTVVLREGQLVWVSGAVKKEGPVTFRQGLTVTQALALAGGAGDFARVRSAYVMRPGGEKVSVNLARILGGRDADVTLRPEDKLVVPGSSGSY